MNRETEFWTVDQLAERLQLKPSWIYQNIAKLPHYKLGNLVRFNSNEVLEYLGTVKRGPRRPGNTH